VTTVVREEFPQPRWDSVRKKESKCCSEVTQRDGDNQRDPIDSHLALMIPDFFFQRTFQALLSAAELSLPAGNPCFTSPPATQ